METSHADEWINQRLSELTSISRNACAEAASYRKSRSSKQSGRCPPIGMAAGLKREARSRRRLGRLFRTHTRNNTYIHTSIDIHLLLHMLDDSAVHRVCACSVLLLTYERKWQRDWNRNRYGDTNFWSRRGRRRAVPDGSRASAWG